MATVGLQGLTLVCRLLTHPFQAVPLETVSWAGEG